MTDILVTYNVYHPAPFGFLTTLFISVTGLNAGSYLASVIFIYLGKKEYLPLAKFSALAVVILWAVAPILLLFDIGQPLRFWHLFVYFDPHSPMAWGAVILTAYPFLASIYLWHLFQNNLKKAKLWGFIGLPIALGSHGFVGFVLSFSKARILWSTSLTPFFFLVTAALAGLALVIIVDTIRYYLILKRFPAAREQELLIFHYLGEALYILIFAELGLILFYLLKLGISPKLFDHVLTLMALGKICTMDLCIPVVLGLILPLVLLVIPKTARSPFGQLIASALIILGIFAMGNLVITAAQSLPLI
ncbi:MAG: polysulfide reductase NrfD [Thermodesulfobacteriota bacterium]|nr:polysulfide reductase NrfD [Thermodesulfobacteriota bacterium]